MTPKRQNGGMGNSYVLDSFITLLVADPWDPPYFRCPYSSSPFKLGLAVTFCYLQLKASLLIPSPKDSKGEGLYLLGVVQGTFGLHKISCHHLPASHIGFRCSTEPLDRRTAYTPILCVRSGEDTQRRGRTFSFVLRWGAGPAFGYHCPERLWGHGQLPKA